VVGHVRRVARVAGTAMVRFLQLKRFPFPHGRKWLQLLVQGFFLLTFCGCVCFVAWLYSYLSMGNFHKGLQYQFNPLIALKHFKTYHYHHFGPTHHYFAQAIKQVLPPESSVDFSIKSGDYGRVRFRYFLKPELLTLEPSPDHLWDYFIDLGNRLNNPDPSWEKYRVFKDVTLYAKPGKVMNPLPQDWRPSPPPLLKCLLTFLCLQGGSFLLGCFLLHLLGVWRGGTLFFLTCAHATGFMLHQFLLLLWGMAGMVLGKSSVVFIWVCPLGLCLFLCLKWRRSPFPVFAFKEIGGCLRSWKKGIPFILLLGILFAILINTVLYHPVGWDPLGHWLDKAKAIYFFKGFFFSETYHNHYPILWPLSIAVHYFWVGTEADFIARWLTALFIVHLTVILYEALKLLNFKPIPALWGVIFYFLFFSSETIKSAYAETFFVFWVALLLTLFLSILATKSVALSTRVVFIFSIAGLSLTKLEGQAAAWILLMAFMAVLSGIKVHPWVWVLLAVSIVFSWLLPQIWIYWQKTMGHLPEDFSLLPGLEKQKLKWIWDVSLKNMREANPNYVFFLGMMFVFAGGNTKAWLRRQDLQFLFWAALGLVLFSGLALLSWGEIQIKQHSLTAVPRLFTHATPAIFLFGAALARPLLHSKQSTVSPQ